MAKPLTLRQIGKLADGTHRVAPSLYVQIRGGSRLWLFRYTLAGKARCLGLGSLDIVTLDEAIAAATAARVRVRRDGVDVVPERRTERAQHATSLAAAHAAEPMPILKSGHTFGDVIDAAVREETKHWKPDPQAESKWTGPIRKYCTKLVNLDVTQITEAALVECLAPWWEVSHQTALRTLGRCVTVMGHVRRLNWITGDNPLVAERIKEKLPRVAKDKTHHHPAMPLRELPTFMQKLAANDGPMMAFFRFLILSGVRCGEAAGALWSEFDLAKRIWTIPGGDRTSRLKRWQHGDFRVPIGDGMLAILQARLALCKEDEDLVFPCEKGGAYSPVDLGNILRVKGYPKGTASVHGMRSALRTFLSSHCDGERVVKELCLHHEIRTETELAYDRQDFLHDRRGLMAAWDAYCAGKVALTENHAVVLPLRNALAA